MFELTVFIDITPAKFIKTLIMLDRVIRVEEVERGMAKVIFENGTSVVVAESLKTVEQRVRDYAETAQRERVGAMVAEEIAKQFPEMADKAWRYEENSK